MNDKERIKMSKFLSLILRHEPEKVGLELDEAGWVGVEDLLAACGKHHHPFSRAELDEVVATNEKKRFAFSDDGHRIRASQGHSVDVELGYQPQPSPDRLFHGTPFRFLESIRAEGLRKGERHHVHLSKDRETAQVVGRRRGDAAILAIDAAAMASCGHEFFVSENGVWLTDHVPAEFIEFPDPERDAQTRRVSKRSSRASMAQETVTICEAESYTAVDGSVVDLASGIRHAIAGTRLYSPKTIAGLDLPIASRETRLTVTDETTIAALRRLKAESDAGHLACLNFASAKNAGGGFLGGSEAQEESLARSSVLYPCLLAAPEYYERNRACQTALYLDLAIWSPAVPFIRDDAGELLAAPCAASVITAPAPNAGAVASNTPEQLEQVLPTLHRRADFVLRIAAERRVNRLVLGAWGCGVFRNDPRAVAQCFASLLRDPGKFASVFDEVVFAIYDRSSEQNTLRQFQEAFR